MVRISSLPNVALSWSGRARAFYALPQYPICDIRHVTQLTASLPRLLSLLSLRLSSAPWLISESRKTAYSSIEADGHCHCLLVLNTRSCQVRNHLVICAFLVHLPVRSTSRQVPLKFNALHTILCAQANCQPHASHTSICRSIVANLGCPVWEMLSLKRAGLLDERPRQG